MTKRETSVMLSTNFAYLISFLIFAFFAYRLGFRHAKASLDHEVGKISKRVDDATQTKEMALLTLNELKHQLSDLEKQGDLHIQELELRGKELSQKHKEQLEHLIVERERHHRELLSQELRLHAQNIKDEVLNFVITKLRNRMEHDDQSQDLFHKNALHMLQEDRKSISK